MPSDEDLLNDIQAAPLPGLNAPFGARCSLTSIICGVLGLIIAGLNAPYGARCFLTSFVTAPLKYICVGPNAPFGARCFLTLLLRLLPAPHSLVLIHLLALGAF